MTMNYEHLHLASKNQQKIPNKKSEYRGNRRRRRRRLEGKGKGSSGGSGGGGSSSGSSTHPDDPIDFDGLYPCEFCGQANDSGLDGTLCFSKDTTIDVMGKGIVTMQELRVGDRIWTTQQTYDTVYAFGHYDPFQSTTFLQLHTTNSDNDNDNDKPLEVTPKHMLFVEGKTHPVTADSLCVGDVLVIVPPVPSHKDIDNPSTSTISKITVISKQGIYAPLTTSGTLVVNGGIAASCYVPISEATSSSTATSIAKQQQAEYNMLLLETSVFSLLSSPIVLLEVSHHDYVHFAVTPLRVFCRVTAAFSFLENVCHIESSSSSLSSPPLSLFSSFWGGMYDSHGMPYYAKIGIAFHQQYHKWFSHPNNDNESSSSSNSDNDSKNNTMPQQLLSLMCVIITVMIAGPFWTLEQFWTMVVERGDVTRWFLWAAALAVSVAMWTALQQQIENYQYQRRRRRHHHQHQHQKSIAASCSGKSDMNKMKVKSY